MKKPLWWTFFSTGWSHTVSPLTNATRPCTVWFLYSCSIIPAACGMEWGQETRIHWEINLIKTCYTVQRRVITCGGQSGSESAGFIRHTKISKTLAGGASRCWGSSRSCETSTTLASPMSMSRTFSEREREREREREGGIVKKDSTERKRKRVIHTFSQTTQIHVKV